MSKPATVEKPSQPSGAKSTAKSLSWTSIGKSLIAGGVAGGLSRTAVAPLERLKILMQIQGSKGIYTGVWQGCKYMYEREGMRGMFQGNGTNCVRIIPNQAVKFMAYEQITRRVSHYLLESGGDGQMTPLLRLGCGACAGIIGMSATYPLDMVRGRLTVQNNKEYTGIMHATRQIIKQEGMIALWRGWVPSVLGVIPYVGLNFSVYETLKDVVLKHYELDDERQLSVTTRLACGALAGTTGQTVAYPLDVVRRRLQMSGWAGAQNLHGEQGKAVLYTGMMDCFSKTFKEEGMRAFFKGLMPNYVKVVPSIAIAFVSYEQVKEMLGVELRISS